MAPPALPTRRCPPCGVRIEGRPLAAMHCGRNFVFWCTQKRSRFNAGASRRQWGIPAKPRKISLSGQRRDRRAHACAITRIANRGKKRGKNEGESRPISRVLSWATIPLGVPLPVRSSSLPGSNASHAMRFPIWPCFRWGLPCRPCYHVRGELLPRRFTLAVPGFPGLGRFAFCCTFRHLTVPGR